MLLNPKSLFCNIIARKIVAKFSILIATKPDINKVRKAFWSRKNRFIFSKTFAKLTKRRSAQQGQNPKAGAVVSLAAMVAGMSSMPIVQTDQPIEDTVEKTDSLDIDVDPAGQLELSRLTEEKSMMTTTDTTMDDDNLSQHTMAMEDDIDSNVNEFF